MRIFPCDGPYEVLERDQKSILIKKQRQNVRVCLNRVKPAYMLADQDNRNVKPDANLNKSHCQTKKRSCHLKN